MGLPTPGKGVAIRYTREHAFELLLALMVQRTGVSPRHAASLVGWLIAASKQQSKNYKGLYAVIFDEKEGEFGTHLLRMEDEDEIGKLIMSTKFFHARILNLGGLASALEDAINRQIDT